MVKPNSKDININFYQVLLEMMTMKLYYSIWLSSEKIIVENLEVFQ